MQFVRAAATRARCHAAGRPHCWAAGGIAAALGLGASACVGGLGGLAQCQEERAPALSKAEFRAFKITSIELLTHNTSRFRVALPTPDAEIGMTTAGVLMVRGAVGDDGKQPVRPYTPTTRNGTKGHFDLVIKQYPEGKVSRHVHSLKVGDDIEVKGCYTKLVIEPNQYTEIGMVAGGTGITPMLQVVEELLDSAEDQTKMTLLYCSQNPAEIILKPELDKLVALWPERFTVHYVVDKPCGGWAGRTGYVDAAMVAETLPRPKEGTKIMVCGPPPMTNGVAGADFKKVKGVQGPLGGLLAAAGYTADMVVKF